MLNSLCVVVVVRLVMLPGEVEVAAVAVQAVVVVGSSPGSGPALSLSYRPLGTAHCAASYAAHGPSHADTRVLRGRGRAGDRSRSREAARAAVCHGRPGAARRSPLQGRRSQLLAGPGGASAAARHFFSCGRDLARPGLRRRQISPLLFLAGPWSSTVPNTTAPASPGPNFGMLLRRDLVELERLPGDAAFCRSAAGLAGPRPLSSSWRRPSLAPGRLA